MKDRDWTVVWETMDDAFPPFYSGTRPKKSSATAPKAGDMIITPNNGSITDDDHPFWLAELKEVRKDSLLVRWWGADEFMGNYQPLNLASSVSYVLCICTCLRYATHNTLYILIRCVIRTILSKKNSREDL